jgi:hypothetical protein
MRKLFLLTILSVAQLLSCGIKPSGNRKPASETIPESGDPALVKPQGAIPKPMRFTKFTTEVRLKFAENGKDALVTFQDVQPIFKRECSGCHNSPEEFDLTSFPFQSIREPDSQKLVDLIIERISSTNPDFRMPLNPEDFGPGTALTEKEQNLIKKWSIDGLLAQAPEAAKLDEIVDAVMMEYSYEDKNEKVMLKKDKKVSGMFNLVVPTFPGKLKSLKYKFFSNGEVVNEVSFDDYNAIGNPKLIVRFNVPKEFI